MFHVGQKVVCVDDDDFAFCYGETMPRRGVIYTIRDLYINGSGQGIRLEEIRNEANQYLQGFRECGFFASRFRPAVERPTDITIFTDILKTVETPPREKVGG